MAFLLMLAEGTANDWSALQAVEDLGRSAASASLAYAAFAVAMTAGRFAADPVAHRFGPVSVVRVGSALAAVGMLVVVLSPTAGGFPLTLLGWVVFGLGLSGIVPQIFTAAGNLGVANPGVTISRVVSAGYVGLLAGPAVIGWLAGGVGLTTALVLPLVFCGVGIALAGAVAPRAADRGGVVGEGSELADPATSGGHPRVFPRPVRHPVPQPVRRRCSRGTGAPVARTTLAPVPPPVRCRAARDTHGGTHADTHVE